MSAMTRSVCAAAAVFALLGWFGAKPVIAADKTDVGVINCLMSTEVKNREGAQGWWDRRSEAEHKVILALPCEERYIPMVCIFLYEPDLIDCTNKGVAEKRATAACQAKGYDLMSQELADCKAQFKKTFKPPFPRVTS
jgi:hypothetical protein